MSATRSYTTAILEEVRDMATQSGTISTADEIDRFPVDLTGGVAYTIGVQGADSGLGTLPNPAFIVFDSANTQVALYDDTFGRDPSGEYTPPNSGIYTIA